MGGDEGTGGVGTRAGPRRKGRVVCAIYRRRVPRKGRRRSFLWPRFPAVLCSGVTRVAFPIAKTVYVSSAFSLRDFSSLQF